jgi:hypothetical protein
VARTKLLLQGVEIMLLDKVGLGARIMGLIVVRPLIISFIGVCRRGSYPVHKGHAVHKCTKRNLVVRLSSNGRRKYADEPFRSLRSLPSLFCEKPPFAMAVG